MINSINSSAFLKSIYFLSEYSMVLIDLECSSSGLLISPSSLVDLVKSVLVKDFPGDNEIGDFI